MTFTILCSCTHGICFSNCNVHCGPYWNAKTINQALTIKHAHLSNFENHQVEIRQDGIIVNQEKGWREVNV